MVLVAKSERVETATRTSYPEPLNKETLKLTRLPYGSRKGAARPSCDPSNTSRHFALGAHDACLVGGNPTCSVPALWGCEGLVAMVLRLSLCMKLVHSPDPTVLLFLLLLLLIFVRVFVSAVVTAVCSEQESFVHRSGRTGRAGNSGVNIVLCSNVEDRQVSVFVVGCAVVVVVVVVVVVLSFALVVLVLIVVLVLVLITLTWNIWRPWRRTTRSRALGATLASFLYSYSHICSCFASGSGWYS